MRTHPCAPIWISAIGELIYWRQLGRSPGRRRAARHHRRAHGRQPHDRVQPTGRTTPATPAPIISTRTTTTSPGTARASMVHIRGGGAGGTAEGALDARRRTIAGDHPDLRLSTSRPTRTAAATSTRPELPRDALTSLDHRPQGRPLLQRARISDDDAVYQDEFVAWLNAGFPDAFYGDARARPVLARQRARPLVAHARADPPRTRSATPSSSTKNTEFAAAIKDVAANAIVAGFVSYGYSGYTSLAGRPRRAGRQLHRLLARRRWPRPRLSEGRRLVDVLDLHWYTEVYANGQRITGQTTLPGVGRGPRPGPALAVGPDLRQEDSWIANDVVERPDAPDPWLQGLIDARTRAPPSASPSTTTAAATTSPARSPRPTPSASSAARACSMATIWDPGRRGLDAPGPPCAPSPSYDGPGRALRRYLRSAP